MQWLYSNYRVGYVVVFLNSTTSAMLFALNTYVNALNRKMTAICPSETLVHVSCAAPSVPGGSDHSTAPPQRCTGPYRKGRCLTPLRGYQKASPLREGWRRHPQKDCTPASPGDDLRILPQDRYSAAPPQRYPSRSTSMQPIGLQDPTGTQDGASPTTQTRKCRRRHPQGHVPGDR